MKKCNTCRETLEFTMFHRCRKSTSGYKAKCKKCRSIKQKEYRRKNKMRYLQLEKQTRIRNKSSIQASNRKWASKSYDERLAYRLNYKYGITIENYNNMFELQDHRCGICKKDQDLLPKKLCVDHCHKTGKVRGLLCDICNRMLGQARDNTDVLNNAIKYLTKQETV